MMKRSLHTLFLAAALFFGAGLDATPEAWALSAGSVYARLEVQGLGDLKEAWEQAMSDRAQMVVKLKSLSARYRAEVSAIDALKQGGVGNLNRRDLERRLSEARALAEQLDGLQSEILRRDALMRQISSKIVGLLDSERTQLEQRLVRGDSSKALIKTLNELSAERERYVQPLPDFDQRRYADVLKDANEAQDPADMLAMADELLDAESEVQAQLGELDERLETLRTRRKLLRRANDFRREERFFEEGDRASTFGTRTRVATVTPETEEGERSNSPPVVGNPRPEAQPEFTPQTPVDAGKPSADESAEPAEVDNGSLSAGGRGDATPDPGLTDNPGTVGVPAEGGRPAVSDPFGTPTDVIVVARQADPNVSLGSSDVPDTQIDGQIKNLEGERGKLERKATELRTQAKQLKQRAKRVD